MTPSPAASPSDRSLCLLGLAVTLAAAVAAIGARSVGVWALEVLPVAIVLPVLWCTRNRLRFTPLVYGLIALHCLVLIIGAHWTYEHVPVGDWLNEALGWKRNNYDRLGHFAQGFVPVIVIREVLLRRTELTSRRLVAVLALFIAMGASAIYEVIEMLLAVTGSAAGRVDAQGDIWDPEWDMFFCLCGATASLVMLSRVHDRWIQRSETPVDQLVA